MSVCEVLVTLELNKQKEELCEILEAEWWTQKKYYKYCG